MQDNSDNNTPSSPGFSTDRLPPTTDRTSESSDDDQAAVDRHIVPDEDLELVQDEEEEGEDLFNDNYLE